MMSTYVDLPPSPASLIHSLRDIGYSLQTAIADIIDNSITANASHIQIRASWNAGDSWLAIIDDGDGMSREELMQAMRFGSTNPLERRSEQDLGRFGLGMKTASFSQCRHLSVLSKKDNQASCCEWDLDLIAKNDRSGWMLAILDPEAIRMNVTLNSIYEEYLSDARSGTAVIWEDMDRINEQGSPQDRERSFNSAMDELRSHLELVFHRFLSPDPGQKKVVISINNDELVAFNPFNPLNNATQELEQQEITIDNQRIVVQPYVLPHHSKIPRQEYERYAGEGGYLHNQGFYIYRKRRLIIKGTWFRLIKKEELNKLIRIRVDIPNTLDHLWKIDVKKSQASPPEVIRGELGQVIRRIEARGRSVYRQRGTRLSTPLTSPVWNRRAVAGTILYTINREHPVLIDLLERISPQERAYFEQVLRMIENSFPRDMFFNDVAGTPEQVESLDLDEEGLELLIDFFVESLKPGHNLGVDRINELLTADPFASNIESTRRILEQRGYTQHE